MPARRTQFSDQFLTTALPVLEALIYDEYARPEDHVKDVFRIMPSNMWGEQSSTMAGTKAVPSVSEGDAPVYDEPIQGFDNTWTHVTYKLYTSFTEELVEDDRLGMVQDTYRHLGLGMYQTRQVVAFNILNNGFSDTGPDGQSLFNSAHPMIGGHTYGNAPATPIALSVAGIREMETDYGRLVNHRAINVMVMAHSIVVPPELIQTLEELVGSPDRPDTDNRAINTFYKKNYKPIMVPYLTSTTSWFAFTTPDQTQLRFYERISPETRTWQDEGTGDVNTRIRCRFSVDYGDWIGTWGTNPS